MTTEECGNLIGVVKVSGPRTERQRAAGWWPPQQDYEVRCTKPKGHNTQQVTWKRDRHAPMLPPGQVFEFDQDNPPTAEQMANAGFMLKGDPCEFRNYGLVVRKESDI